MDKNGTRSVSAICNFMEDCYLDMMSSAKSFYDDLDDALGRLNRASIKKVTKSSEIDMSVVSKIFEGVFQDVEDSLQLIEHEMSRLEELRKDIKKHIETKKAAE